MPLFRKKPVTIEAARWTGSMAAIIAVAGRDLPTYGHAPDGSHKDGSLRIATLEGDMELSPGDWLIKGVKGELYPCKDDIFRLTYESLEQPRGTAAEW